MSIINGVTFISEEVKGHTCRYLEIMEECINPALHAWIVIEHVVVEVTELRDVLLWDGAL